MLRRKQKLVGLIPHDLRRTFARYARTADISQLDVMQLGAGRLRGGLSKLLHRWDSLKKLEAKRENDRREPHVFSKSDPQNDDETEDSQVN